MNTFGIQQSWSSWYGLILMSLIGAMSVYLVALAVMRLKFFRRIRVDARKVMGDVRRALVKEDAQGLEKLMGQRAEDPPLMILVSTALHNRAMDKSELHEVLRSTQVRQRERLGEGLSTFGTLATIAPFLGLLATVLGIIESFHNLAQSGASGPNVVANGVAAALWGTAAGLVVAIPSVVAYNVFNRLMKRVLADLDLAGRELVLMLKMNRSALTHWAASEGGVKES